MSLETGGRLLHYRLVEKLGEGGMGVVWKALDTSLDRAVAIKVLPEGLSQDPERLARFEREAKTLAALNHPNIAAIHSVHHQDDRRFIVMEYVVGADLATRLARGPVPLDETVELMRQVAFALEAAHAGGVVHRDLKPANIVITPDGTAKVLDFGLAKAFYGDLGASAPGNPALSPTVTSAGTLPGVILGTAAYMSPEQARGRAVDRRADVWAFGCVLYEMLSGEVPFPGETVSDVLAGVLKAEPAWDGLPAATPSGVRRVIERCLRKDPRQRYHDVADLRLDLDERAGRSPHERGPSRAPASRARVAAGVAGCLALGLLAGWLLADRWPDRPVADRTTRSIVATDPAGRIDAVSISDDGSAIVARIDEALYWRRLDEFDLRPVPRSSRSTGWVVSPDGDGLLFHVSMDEIIRRGELRRWSAENGNTVTIRETDRMLAPLEWGERGLVARAGQTSIARFETLDTPVDRMERLFETTTWTRRVETAVRVPDSDRWIVGIFPVGGERPELVIATPGDDESPLLADAARPRIAPGGRLLFLQDDTLMAIAFDRSALRVAGDRIPLIAGVVDYDLSRDGTLVYLPSSGERTARRVVRVERDGSTSVLVAGGHNYVHARLSPDGRYVSTVDPQLRLHEIATGSTRLLEFAAAGATGADHVWTPDGRFVVYTAFLVDGDKRRCVLYRQAVDGRTPPEALIEPEGDDEVYPTDYAPDGSGLVYALYRDQTDLWFQPADGSPPRAILATATSEDLGRFSPDMRWLAYESNEGGTQEVWIAAYSKADRRLGAKWRVSSGGKDPIWSPRGDELFYEDLDGRLIAVALSAGDGGVALGESSALFDLRELRIRSSGDQSYDVDPSGRSFIMVTSDRPEVREVRMVSGWLAELDRLAPPAR